MSRNRPLSAEECANGTRLPGNALPSCPAARVFRESCSRSVPEGSACERVNKAAGLRFFRPPDSLRRAPWPSRLEAAGLSRGGTSVVRLPRAQSQLRNSFDPDMMSWVL